MDRPVLYRRRFIPDEIVCLKNDVIVYIDAEIIVTEWSALKPRADFAGGSSCYFLNRGFKVSRFIGHDSQCVYHYCDIIETVYNREENAYVFNDLLVDVVVQNDGFVKVLDLAEVPDALDKNLISVETAKNALRQTDELLNIIYSGRFCELTTCLDKRG